MTLKTMVFSRQTVPWDMYSCVPVLNIIVYAQHIPNNKQVAIANQRVLAILFMLYHFFFIDRSQKKVTFRMLQCLLQFVNTWDLFVTLLCRLHSTEVS